MNMKKFKFFFNLDKEEKWLNEKSDEGWELYDKKTEYKFHKTIEGIKNKLNGQEKRKKFQRSGNL